MSAPLRDDLSRFSESLSFAETIAREAGAIALRWFRRGGEVEAKEDASPVTVADRTVESHLRAAIKARYPGHAIFGEEYGSEGPDGAPIWIVDPIDGTRSFITGWPIWGTLLALTGDEGPRLGVIEMPALGERWAAERGRGSWHVGRDESRAQCRTSACGALAGARFYTTSLLYFGQDDREKMERLCAGTAVPRFGGDCYSYGLLASGHVDLVAESLLQPYDYMALVPIVEEAGGVITDWSGARLTMESDGRVVAAATRSLHEQALRMLAD